MCTAGCVNTAMVSAFCSSESAPTASARIAGDEVTFSYDVRPAGYSEDDLDGATLTLRSPLHRLVGQVTQPLGAGTGPFTYLVSVEKKSGAQSAVAKGAIVSER